MDSKYSYKYDDKGIYCYKDTDVLINKLSIKSDVEFNKAERLFAALRHSELDKNPLPGNFDFNHLKAIHKYLFQDLFDWAGKIRTVAIAKKSMFCLPQFIDSYANDIFSNLAMSNYLEGLSEKDFIEKLTELYADINALHPFREGNGRTQREFIKYVAGINGYGLEWSLIKSDENIIASHESVNGNNTKLLYIITKIIYPLTKEETKRYRKIFNK